MTDGHRIVARRVELTGVQRRLSGQAQRAQWASVPLWVGTMFGPPLALSSDGLLMDRGSQLTEPAPSRGHPFRACQGRSISIMQTRSSMQTQQTHLPLARRPASPLAFGVGRLPTGVRLRFGLLAVFVIAVLVIAAVGARAIFAQATARLGAVSGTVAIVRADGSALQPAPVGTQIGPGDRVATVGRSSALVVLPGVGEVELGGETTLIVRELGVPGAGGSGGVLIELVEGFTLHRLTGSPGTASSATASVGGGNVKYRVVGPSDSAMLLARPGTEGALFGVGRDANGNLTVACGTCPSGAVGFPAGPDGGAGLVDGQARTLTSRGELVDHRVRGSIYDTLARGESIDDDGGSAPSTARLPAGQRTGSRADRRADPDDDDGDDKNPPMPNQPASAAQTPTPGPANRAPTVTATPTVSAAPTVTATASGTGGTATPTATGTPTATPTATQSATPAATPTAMPTTTQTATPSATQTATPNATPTQAVLVRATIANFVYLPDPIRVPVGGTVQWTNLDFAEHTVTAEDLSWTSPVLQKDQVYSRTFTQAGTIPYFCEPHPQMRADIIVE